ncbi:unnamed protein product [Lactuca saligna]|uniref:Uncharacterized protein n=1 Tax=Lactuca saligna TaxID=75948 RepID=A0AA35V4Y1_LACSI|nr:unnamed protein product [Lactuca saligna]
MISARILAVMHRSSLESLDDLGTKADIKVGKLNKIISKSIEEICKEAAGKDLAMELESDTEHNHNMMIDHKIPTHNMQIDPSRSCFPCCIVWTPLPVVSWLLLFVGHIGIGKEDGVILDFAGPNFVCVDNFTFGAVTRYIQISKDKVLDMPAYEA